MSSEKNAPPIRFQYCECYRDAIQVFQQKVVDGGADVVGWMPNSVDRNSILRTKSVRVHYHRPSPVDYQGKELLILSNSVNELRTIIKDSVKFIGFSKVFIFTSLPECVIDGPELKRVNVDELSFPIDQREAGVRTMHKKQFGSLFIDSFGISINHEDLPFLPDLSGGKVVLKKIGMRKFNEKYSNTKYTYYVSSIAGVKVEIIASGYNYKFIIKDLNGLRLNLKSELDLMMRIYEILNLLFYGQLSIDVFFRSIVQEVHLACFISVAIEHQDDLTSAFFKFEDEAKHRSRMLKEYGNEPDIPHGVNLKGRYQSLAIYNPAKKPCNPVIDAVHYIKVEYRQKKRRGQKDRFVGRTVGDMFHELMSPDLAVNFLHEIRRLTVNGARFENNRRNKKIKLLNEIAGSMNPELQTVFTASLGAIDSNEFSELIHHPIDNAAMHLEALEQKAEQKIDPKESQGVSDCIVCTHSYPGPGKSADISLIWFRKTWVICIIRAMYPEVRPP